MAKQNTRQTLKKDERKKILFWGIVSVIVFVLLFVWFFGRNIPYSPDKQKTKNNVQAVLAGFNSSDEQVYSNFKDNGCGSSVTGLQTSIGCSFFGEKFYKSTKKLSDNFHAIDVYMTSNGWQRQRMVNDTDEEFNNALKSEKIGRIFYSNPNNFPYTDVFIEYFKDNQHYNEENIKKHVQENRISRPVDMEYIYGLTISSIYFSCTNDSFFKLPCPDYSSKPSE